MRESSGAKLGGRPTGFRRTPLSSRQPVCKPGSGWPAKHARRRDGHSSGTPVTRRLQQPTRTAGSGHRPRSLLARKPRAVPIRSCSRWGLPCRRRYRRRGALLPHRFTLTAAIRNAPRRSVLCGTVPGLAPAGRYPAPLVHGARTFLPGNLSVPPERPSDRLTVTGMGALAARRQGAAEAAAGNDVRCGREPRWSRGRPRLASSSCSVLARRWRRRRRRRVAGGNGAGRR